MTINITSLPVGSYVKDPSTLFNGVPIKWRILDFNHAGYPAGTATLFAWNAKRNVSIVPDTTTRVNKTFRDIPITASSGGGKVGNHLDTFYENLGSKLKAKVVDTPLDIGYSGEYAAYSTAFKKENHKIFLFGAGEYNYGASTYLSRPTTQKYFANMATSPTLLYQALGLVTADQPILSRDIKVSTSDYYCLYPGSIYGTSGDYATSQYAVNIFPMMNISTSGLTVSDNPDSDGSYILNLVDNKFLVQDGLDIKRYYNPSSGFIWESIGQAPVTKAMFDQYGMKDFSQVISLDWDKLNSSDAEILCWTDEVSATPGRYLHKIGVPKGILLKMTESIAISELQSLRLDSIVSSTSILKIVLSGDDGVTWYGSNGIVGELTSTSVSASGYSSSEFNALAKSDLNALLKSKKIRVALFLEKQNVSDTLEVKALFATEVKYLSTPTVENQTVTYELAQKQTPSYFVSKDDGLNWLELKEDELTLLTKMPAGNKLRLKVKLQSGIELHGLSYSWG